MVERGANVRLIRDNVVVHEGKLSQLKRFKDDAREVVAGQECGMAFENYQDMQVGRRHRVLSGGDACSGRSEFKSPGCAAPLPAMPANPGNP